MQKWLGYVEKYSPNGLLEPWPETDYRDGILATGLFLREPIRLTNLL